MTLNMEVHFLGHVRLNDYDEFFKTLIFVDMNV